MRKTTIVFAILFMIGLFVGCDTSSAELLEKQQEEINALKEQISEIKAESFKEEYELPAYKVGISNDKSINILLLTTSFSNEDLKKIAEKELFNNKDYEYAAFFSSGVSLIEIRGKYAYDGSHYIATYKIKDGEAYTEY